MAELIEDPKKKNNSFGDAAAAASDPGVTQLKVGNPGDFPVNPDGTPMQKPPAAPGFGAVAIAPASTERPPANSTSTLAQPQSDYARQMGEVAGFFGALPVAAAKFITSAPGGGGPLASGAQAPEVTPARTQALTGYRMNEITDPRSLLNPNRQDPTQPATSPAPAIEPAAATASPVAPIAAGAVKTQGQMNMEADLKSAADMKAERLAAEAQNRGPQNVVLHSGNDWASRNALRNLEVSASSMTAQPKDLMAYEAARKHDTALQGGGTAADIANVVAANRNNEINSTAQVANARTAQQAEQFGASHDLAKQRLAMESNVQNAHAAQYGAEARLKSVQANAAEKLAALQNKYMTAKPEEQAAIAKQIQTLSGKSDKVQLHTVNQPDTMAPDGMTKLGGGQRLVVQGADGSFHEVPVGSNQQQAPQLPPKDKLVKDKVYPTSRGNAKWDGSQFIPV